MSLFNPNTNFYDSFYDKAKYLMAWRLALVITIVLFILSVVVYVGFTNIVPTIIVFSTFLISVLTFFYLKITKNFTPVFWAYVIVGTIIIHIALNTVLDIPHYGG